MGGKESSINPLLPDFLNLAADFFPLILNLLKDGRERLPTRPPSFHSSFNEVQDERKLVPTAGYCRIS